jgi:membrane-associated phospholipid phosphatase
MAVRRLASFFAVILCSWISVDTRLAAQQVGGDWPTPSQTDPQAQQGSGLPDRTVSVHKLPTNILEDQKRIFSFPQALAKGQHWWPTIGITAGTGALIASDPYSAPPFLTTNRFSGFNRVFSSANTGAFIAAVPATMYGVGWLRKDSYARDTALLAGEALADGFILAIPFKGITGRRQPLSYSGNGPYSDSFFNGSHNPFSSGGFYSQRAMAATAVATVIAMRYRRHRWVPYVAYGLAGAISFSRITRSTHFPGDVFFGGAMGYVISRYAVLSVQN